MRNLLFFLAFLPMPFLSFFRPWAGMLIWGWLALLNPHRDLWGFASTMPYNQIIAIATIAGWLVSRERKLPHFDLTLCLILALFVLATVSAFNSLAPELTWPKWNEFGKTVIYVVLLSVFVTTKARIHALIWLIVLSIGFYGVKGGVLFIVSGGTHQFAGPPDSHIGDRNHLAVAMLMAIPLMNYLRNVSASIWLRRGLIAALALSILAVIGTYSRGGFIGLAAVGAFMWWRSRSKLTGLIAVGVVALGLAWAAPEAWVERMQTIETADKQDESFQGRLIAWRTYWAAALDRPFTGTGMYALNSNGPFLRYMPYGAGLDSAKAAHSIYFQVAGELGLISLSLYIMLASASLAQLQKSLKYDGGSVKLNQRWASELARTLLASLVAFLVSGAAVSLAFYDLYFVIVCLGAALRRVLYDSKQHQTLVPHLHEIGRSLRPQNGNSSAVEPKPQDRECFSRQRRSGEVYNRRGLLL